MPQFGVYFDTGTSSPYGRKLGVSWNTGSTDMIVNGLRNASTDGLRIVFDNPLRAGGLPAKFFRFAPAGTSDCIEEPQVTGNVWTFPTSGTAATNTAAAPGNLTLNGCANKFDASTSTDVAGSPTSLKLETSPRIDTRLYGTKINVPGNVGIFSSGWGSTSGWCSPSTITSVSTGLTPAAYAFNLSGCPSGVPVGTASLGAASGHIYVISGTPMPYLAVYFDTGVATPYGRRLSVDWGPDGYGETNLNIYGLQGAAGDGLKLDFNSGFWTMDGSECYDQDASAVLRTYPASGTASTVQPTLYSTLGITGC
jgi:hypothetical protein